MKPHRRGYTLVELLVVFTLAATLLGTIAMTMHTLSHADRRLRDRIASDRALEQVVRHLRADVHQALEATTGEAAEPPDLADHVDLTLSDEQRIQYAVRSGRVERLVRRGENIIHHESYRLPRGSTAGWVIDTGRERPLVSLVLRQPARSGATPHHRRFAAALRLLPDTSPPASP